MRRLPTLASSLVTAVALAVTVAACSSSKSVGGDAVGSTSVSSTTENTTPDTTGVPDTTAAAPTSTDAPAPGPVCDDIAPTGAAVDVNAVNGDWNGDGAQDSAVSWGEPTGSGVDWFVRMQLTGAGNSAIFLGDVGAGFVRVTGRADVDFSLGAPEGSNEDELIAVVEGNAAGFNLGVFGLDQFGCVFQFDNGGGETYLIPVHNSVATLAGMTCDGGAGSRFVVRLEATTGDGVNFTTSDIRVQRTDDNSLADMAPIAGALTSASPGLARYGDAECEGASLLP